MQKAVNVMRIWFYLAFSSWGLLKSLVCLVVTIIGSNLNVCGGNPPRDIRAKTTHKLCLYLTLQLVLEKNKVQRKELWVIRSDVIPGFGRQEST